MKRAWSRKNLWERLPAGLRRPIGSGLSCLPPGWLLGRRFREQVRFLKASERWPAERWRAWQLEQLRSICRLAWERTAYYRRTFQDCGFHPDDLRRPEDIARLPLIDKDTLRPHVDEMLAVDRDDARVDYVSTSGTGGRPFDFYIGAERSGIEYGYLTTSWQRFGYRLGMPLAVLRGRVVAVDDHGERYEFDPILRHHYFSTFHLTDENMRGYVHRMEQLGEWFLHAYPSSADTLARFLKRNDLPAPRGCRGIILESENLYPDQRERIEEAFGARAFSCYGHSEKLVLAVECEESHDYHVWPTYGYFELLDESGHPVREPGQRGEIVGTGFINRVMPFIRYRTGDYAEYGGERCSACGREHIVLRRIEGRWPAGDLVANDGSLVSLTALNLHDDALRHVRQFQFRQDEPGRAVLCISPADGFGRRDQERIQESLDRRLAGRVQIRVELVDTIPLTSRGKLKLVDQRIPEQRLRQPAVPA